MILGRSALMSLSRDDSNAEERSRQRWGMKGNEVHSLLKQFSMKERARFCKTMRESNEMLSSRASSSTFLRLGALCFLARAMSSALPASFVRAC